MDTCNIEAEISSVKFMSCVRFLGVILEDSLRWKSHVTHVMKKCTQRMYILRRMRMIATSEECLLIYKGLIRSLLEYACPAFIDLSIQDSKRLQRIQKRCLRAIGQDQGVEDLDSRRKAMAFRLYEEICIQETIIKDLLPPSLPSCRTSVISSNSSLRRSSFLPMMSILVSSTHCD